MYNMYIKSVVDMINPRQYKTITIFRGGIENEIEYNIT